MELKIGRFSNRNWCLGDGALTDAERWIQTASTATPRTNFAIVVEGEAVGGIGLKLGEDVYRLSAEIGYWLGEEFWGRGIAPDAGRAMTDYAFSTFGLCRVYAGVFEWNPASIRVPEKAGYECEGRLKKAVTKDGQTIDERIYAKIQ